MNPPVGKFILSGRILFALAGAPDKFKTSGTRHPTMKETRIAAGAGFLAVILGAFGAHGLKTLLAQNETAAIWETAVFYHFIHAVMLFVLAERKPFPAVAWWSFLIGVIIFSGSLYLLAVTNVRWLGAITPFGGLAFLLGWAWLIFSGDGNRRLDGGDRRGS